MSQKKTRIKTLANIAKFSLLLTAFYFFAASTNASAKVSLPPTAFLPQFQPDPTGAATTNIPLEKPPGFAPALSITYHSEGGPGILGTGWSLNGLQLIARDPSQGIKYDASEKYTGPDGVLFFDGSIYRGKSNPQNQYAINGSADDPSSITATTTNNTVFEYGTGPGAKVVAPEYGKGRLWALSRATDAYGNEYTIDYDVVDGDQIPIRIRYQSAGGTTQEIQFTYEDRTDPREIRETFSFRTRVIYRKRLTSITMTSGGNTIRTYSFTYESVTPTFSSRLISILNRDRNGNVLYNLNLSYSSPSFGVPAASIPTNICRDGTPGCNDWSNWKFQFPDVNGDGLVDLCYRHDTGGVQCHFGDGSGYWSPYPSFTSGICRDGALNCNDGDNHPYIYFADLNQDGRDDLITRYDDGIHNFLSTGSGFGPTKAHNICRNDDADCVSSESWDSITLTEVNGDGYPDLCYRGNLDGIRCFYGAGNGYFAGSPSVADRLCGNGYPGCDDGNNHPYIWYIDMDADGIADFVYRADDGIHVRLKRGNAFSEDIASTICSNSDGDCEQHNLSTIRFPDVNGDGIPDLCHRGDKDGVRCYRGTGQGGWEASPYLIEGACASGQSNCDGSDNYGRMYYPDLNGDGLADYVFRGNNGMNYYLNTGTGFQYQYQSAICYDNALHCNDANNYSTIRFIDNDGDGRDELFVRYDDGIKQFKNPLGFADTLVSITNGNRSVSLNYQPTLQTSGAIQPGTLSYPLVPAQPSRQLLTRTELNVSGSPRARTDFSYSNARKHHSTDREKHTGAIFETIETRPYVYDGATPVMETYSRVRLAQNFDHQGSTVEQQTLLYNSTVLAQTNTTFSTIPSPYAGQNRNIPIQVQTVASQNDHAGNQLYQTRVTLSNHDAYGHARTINNEGVTASSTDDTTQTITYDSCAPGLKANVEVRDTGGTLINSSTTTYGANCRPIQTVTGAAGTTTTTDLTYDPEGRPATITKNGLTQTLSYSGERATITGPDGREKITEVDPETGRTIYTRDKNGNYQVNEYDTAGRITRSCRAAGTSCASATLYTTRDYTSLTETGGTVSESNSLGLTRNTTLDELGRVTAMTALDDRGSTTQTNSYDAFGRAIQTNLDDGSTTYTTASYNRDSFGRTTTVQTPGPNGSINTPSDLTPTAVIVAGQFGIETEKTGATGQAMYEVHDLKNRLLQRDYPTEDNGASAWGRDRWHYDARGLPVRIERGYGPARGSISFNSDYEITITYDILGRKTSQTEADKGTISYAYHSNGKIRQKILPDGTNIYYDYNSNGQLTGQRTDGATLATYTYENGKVKTLTDDSGIRTYYYDAHGRVSRLGRTFETDKVFDITYEYDNYNRPILKRIDGSNLELQYTYFNTGQLKSITLNDPDHHTISDDTLVLLRYEGLTAQGKPRKATYGNGVSIDWSYQPETGLMTNMQARSVSTLADMSYTYRDDRLLASITDNHGGDHNESYSYDAAHRLKSATGPYGDQSTPTRTIQYRYAADGQMIQNGENAVTQNYSGPKPHQLTNSSNGLAYTYNSRGSVNQKFVAGNTVDISYNHLNRPEKIDVRDSTGKTSVTNLTYSSRGQRFKKDYTGEGDNIQTYYLDGGYQVRMKDATELHTLIVNKPDGLLATLSFELPQFTASAGYSDIYLGRTIAVAGLGVASWKERGANLKQFFHYWKHTNLFLGIIGFGLILFGILGLSRNLRTSVRAQAAEINGMLASPRRVFALATSQILLMNFIFLPAVGCVNNSGSGSVAPNDLIGNHFFISNHLRSNFLVTDGSGKAITKYAYMPYGKLNNELTNDDLDGDGKSFQTTQKYTGQEFDFETGLYNYNARIYDPETARFLQTDPKHKDMPGWSNYDRYSYVHGNPINMIDPSGEIAWQVWAQTAVAMNKGDVNKTVKGLHGNINTFNRSAFKFARKFGDAIKKYPGLLGFKGVQNAIRIAGTSIGDGARWLSSGGSYEKHRARNDLAKLCEQGFGACTLERVLTVSIKIAVVSAMVFALVWGGIMIGASISGAVLGGMGVTAATASVGQLALAGVAAFGAGLAVGAMGGYMYGYAYGGFQGMTIANLTWNHQEAQRMGNLGAIAGGNLMSAGTGNFILNNLGVGPITNGVVSQVSNYSYFSDSYWRQGRAMTYEDHISNGTSWALSERDIGAKSILAGAL